MCKLLLDSKCLRQEECNQMRSRASEPSASKELCLVGWSVDISLSATEMIWISTTRSKRFSIPHPGSPSSSPSPWWMLVWSLNIGQVCSTLVFCISQWVKWRRAVSEGNRSWCASRRTRVQISSTHVLFNKNRCGHMYMPIIAVVLRRERGGLLELGGC